LDGCEVSGNIARGADGTLARGAGHGGGIYENGSGSAYTNCTISGNQTESPREARGSGIYCAANPSIEFCTIANNVGVAGSEKRGGGIYSEAAAGNGPSLFGSIIANNTGPAPADGPNLYGNFVSGNYNLIAVEGGYSLTGTTTNNITGQNPLLGPLQDNGGPTWTHALGAGSPALDAIPASALGGVTTDQRGEPRPSPATGLADIGAFEHQRNPVQRIVTNNNDSGAGSLRQILSDCYPGDSVIFDAGLNGQTITLTTGELLIKTDLTITGLGMNNLTISGNNASRIFNIAEGLGVAITDLTIANGKAPNPWGVDAKGGGIYSEATRLHLRRLLLRDCLSLAAENGGGYGGAIYHSGGEELSLWDCRIVGNTVAGYTNPGAGFGGSDVVKPGVGGGIYCATSSGQFAMIGCEVSDNMAQSGASSLDHPAEAKGGGVYFQCMLPSGFTNCTLSGNITDGADGSYGGGIYAASSCTFRFCTVTLNETRGDGTKEGGGIYGEGILKNSLFANNSSTTGADLKGTFTSQNYNLIRNTTGYTLSGTTTNNITGQDPLLGPLQDNGGPTLTHALLDGSPALDWIPASEIGTITTDQRGQPRPSPSDGNADIGAYEHRVTSSGPTWSNLTTYSNFLDTANAQPMWDSFKLDVYSLGQPGSLTLQKTANRLSITTVMDQGLSWPYGQWAPPGVNEVTVDAAGKDKLYRFKANVGSTNASVAQNPMIRLSLNGRTQGPGQASREFSKGDGTGAETNGPTSAAVKSCAVYLWPSASGTFAPTFLVFDDDASRGGTIFVDSGATLDAIPKADFTAGNVVADQGQGASSGFAAGAGDAQWAAQAVPFTGVFGYTGAPTFVSSLSSSLMTLGVSGTVAAGQSGYVKYGSAKLFTTQADKLYLAKVRVAASTNTGLVPDLRLFLSRGNAVAYLLQSRNDIQNSGPTTTPRDYVCVFETDNQNAGLWDMGIEVIAEPNQAGTLQISRVTIEEYAKPAE
jgi:hypothetical protein